MKRAALIFILLSITVALVTGQQATPDPRNLGIDTAQQKLQEVSISTNISVN